jgi:Cu/Ag efflux protein CusF
MKIKKVKLNLLITTLFAAGALALPICAQTAPADTAAPAASPAKSTTHFTGTVSAVDADGKTISAESKKAGKKTFDVTDSTKITGADGSAATLADLKTGDHIRVTFKTTDDGKLEAETVKVGTSTKSSPKPS